MKNKKNSAHALGASEAWHLSLPLMISFNKTEAAIFPMKSMLPGGFQFLLRSSVCVLCIDHQPSNFNNRK